jgi:ankyrin repeat protein
MKRTIFLAVVLITCVFMSATIADAAMNQDDFASLCSNGTPEAVKRAIADGADVNEHAIGAWTALMRAAFSNGDPGVIAVLLEAGAVVKERDTYGNTALMFACGAERATLEAVSLLLKAGADVNAQDDRMMSTPLMRVTWNQDLSGSGEGVFAVLLEMINSKERRPPIDLAGIISVLLDAGADANTRDQFGNRAIDYAFVNPKIAHTDAFWKLFDAGAGL